MPFGYALVQEKRLVKLAAILLQQNCCQLDRLSLQQYRGLYRGFKDTGYLPFYFQGYRILFILLPGIWDTWFNIFVTSRDTENLEKLIVGIFANL